MAKPLDAQSLRLFVAVCEQGSLAAAAQEQALVASALSKRIAALEADTGVVLLQRGRRGVVPTPAGEALLRQAREILAGMDRARAELADFGRGVRGSVRVLASTSALAQRLPDDLAGFLAAQPGLRIDLAEIVSPEIVRQVQQGSADLGVLWDRADCADLQVHPYRADRLCVAVVPGHPLARRGQLRFAEVLQHELIGIGPGGLMDALIRRQAALLGLLPHYRAQASGIDAASRMAAAGLGLAIVPQEAATPFAGAGRLRLLPLHEDWARRALVLVTRAEPLCSTPTRLLRAHLQALASGDASS